jgi:hypothetical protein
MSPWLNTCLTTCPLKRHFDLIGVADVFRWLGWRKPHGDREGGCLESVVGGKSSRALAESKPSIYTSRAVIIADNSNRQEPTAMPGESFTKAQFEEHRGAKLNPCQWPFQSRPGKHSNLFG